eukprot:2692688-Pyramimonas_sp.AAC.1
MVVFGAGWPCLTVPGNVWCCSCKCLALVGSAWHWAVVLGIGWSCLALLGFSWSCLALLDVGSESVTLAARARHWLALVSGARQ